MKIRNYVAAIGCLVALSFATLTRANPHQCPSITSIKQTLQNKTLLHVWDYYLGGKNSQLTAISSFDTNETWYFYYRSQLSAKSDNEAWKNFQDLLDTTPNTTRYAKDNFYMWDCEYIYEDLQIYMIARLIGPATSDLSENKHPCPSMSSIKKKITDKNLVEFKQSPQDHFGGPPGVTSDGMINFFDSFDTNDTWIFHFEVDDIWDKGVLWDLFQNYLTSYPDKTRMAKNTDYDGYINYDIVNDGRMVCRYSFDELNFGMGDHFYNVFAVLKAP
jgi:hypothetical protein